MRIAAEALDAVKAHAEEGYPYEICGVLLGPSGSRKVTESVRARNIREDRPQDRYEIDPLELLRIQRKADDDRKDVLGFYHSHPDHPAIASVWDDEQMWPGYVYLIVACQKGKVVDANGFVTMTYGGPHRNEPVEVA
ncbi:MAG TPA: M67 family metallopeptidase [Candidatus Dormibacteraeota bacterium]